MLDLMAPTTHDRRMTESNKSISETADLLKAKILDCATRPDFASKILRVSEATCSSDDFNVWHSNADKGGSAKAPWGTPPTRA